MAEVLGIDRWGEDSSDGRYYSQRRKLVLVIVENDGIG
jgi:hypothetical protein